MAPVVTQRLKYFTGLFLQEDDFKLEQDYHRDRLSHHNRLLHTPGICEGLTVEAAIGATQIIVKPGTALDSLGQFIVLAADRTLNQTDIGNNKGKTVLLVIQYGEQGVKKSSDESSPSRTEDSPKLLFIPANDTATSGVRLAQIEFNSDGSVKSKIDTVRVAAGVNIGDELSINKLMLKAPGRDSSLWPIMTAEERKLNLTGSLSVSSALTVGGALSVTGALGVTGAATLQNATIQQNLTVAGTVSGSMNFGSQLRQMINLWNASYGIGIQNATQYFRTDANFAWFLKGAHNDATFNAGANGSALMVLNAAGSLGIGTTDPKDKLHVAGGNIRWGNNSMLFDNQGGSLELGGNNTTAGTGTPYIDFHFKDKTEDFNVRLINDADGQLSLVAPTLSISGNASFGSTVRQMINLYSTSYGIGVQGYTHYFRTNENFAWYKNGVHDDTALSPGAGGSALMVLAGGNLGIGTSDPKSRLHVVGVVGISNGTNIATRDGHMAAGSLTIGDISLNYGGGNDWNANTAGLLLEALKNTEIAVHDSGNRIASLMYYEGDADNRITIGRNMGWGAIGQVLIAGPLKVTSGAITPTAGNSASAGIYFPVNPGGGAGDEAFIRYYAESGETTKLLIGVGNDSDDSISFYQAGGERMMIQDGYVKLRTIANNASAASILSGAPNGTTILGGCWRSGIYFYWKDDTGVIYSLRLAGTVGTNA